MPAFPRLLTLATLGTLALPAMSEEPEFKPRTVIPRSFPAIETPKLVTVEEAEKENWVKDRELVLGVVVGGEARAYPINTLTGPRREIINDELGERSIAATW